MLAELDGDYYEAFSLAVVRAWLARNADRKPPPVEPRSNPRSATRGSNRSRSVRSPYRSTKMPPRWFLTPVGASSTISRCRRAPGRVKTEQLKGSWRSWAPRRLASRSALHARRARVSRRRGARQSDRRHARQPDEADAGIRGRREVVLLLVAGTALSFAVASPSACGDVAAATLWSWRSGSTCSSGTVDTGVPLAVRF